MTQKSLAEALHVTDKAVSKWERGLSVPDICLFPELASILGVSVGELFQEGSDDETPSRLLRIYQDSADVRTPLHIILGCVELISKYRDDGELFGRYRDIIRISGEYLLSVFEKARDTDDLQRLLSEKNPSRHRPVPIADFSGRRFLVVEDIPVNREIVGEILADTGAQVEFAEDGLQCVNRVSSAPEGYYDAILMDLTMPNMDGLEATRRLRQLGVNVPIIALTANVRRQDRQAALEVGMNAFAEKPIHIERLFSTIRECTGG